MASYKLYFLLPKKSSSNPKTASVPDFTMVSNDNSRSVSSGPPAKKARVATPTKTEETRSLSELLSEFHKAIENDTYERKHALISRAIMVHAMEDICKDPILLKSCSDNSGLSRAEIMDWIATHETYSKWVVQQMSKLEMKSYQANLSKVMIQVGYTRLGTTGRHVKWMLPEKVMKNYKDSKAAKKSQEVEKEAKGQKGEEKAIIEVKKEFKVEENENVMDDIERKDEKIELEDTKTADEKNVKESQMEDNEQKEENQIFQDKEESQQLGMKQEDDQV